MPAPSPRASRSPRPASGSPRRPAARAGALGLRAAACLLSIAPLLGCTRPRGASGPGLEDGALAVQPYLQDVRPDGVTVLYWTEGPVSPSRVEHGPGLDRFVEASQTPVDSVGRTLHRAQLRGMQPGERVRYRVRAGGAVSPTYGFRTAVGRTDGFLAVVLGDGRTDDEAVVRRHQRLTRIALELGPDLALHLGDMVQTGDALHWDRFFRRIATASDPRDPGPPFASQVPYYLLVGNHEIYGTDGSVVGFGSGNLETSLARYQSYVEAPETAGAPRRFAERYYSFDYGPATFVVLDANNTSDDELDNNREMPDGSTPDWEPGSAQHRWLEGELGRAAARSAFTFVAMHPAPFSRGSHGAPGEAQSGHSLRALDPLFRRYGVDAVLSAHDHMVERSLSGPPGFEEAMDDGAPENLSYFVTGNAGHSTRAAARGWERWMSVRGDGLAPFHSRYFYDWEGTERTSLLRLEVEPLGGGRFRASFEVVRDDGRTFDRFSLEREAPRSAAEDLERVGSGPVGPHDGAVAPGPDRADLD